MFCRKLGTDARSSEFSPSATSKKLVSYDLAIAELIKTGKKLAEAEELLGQAFLNAASSGPAPGDQEGKRLTARDLWANRPPAEVGLSREAVAAFEPYIRCLQRNDGPEWFGRSPGPGTVFSMAKSPYQGLRRVEADVEDDGHSAYTLPDMQMVDEVSSVIRRLHFSAKLWEYRVVDPTTGRFLEVLSQAEYVQQILDSAAGPLEPGTAGLLLGTTAAHGFVDKPLEAAHSAQHLDLAASLRLGPISDARAVITQELAKEPSVQLPCIPAPVTNDPNRPTFTYVDLGAFTEGPTPAFDNWLLRIAPECRGLFQALLFAPLVASCKHRKLCWIRSEGYDGKSTFFGALDQYLGGKMVGTMTTASLTSEFGLESAIGKRILILGDCQNPHLLSTNAIHWITGGDLTNINRKGIAHISYRFRAMLFVGANCTPEINLHQGNAASRLAYIPMEPPTEEQLKHYCVTRADGTVRRYKDGTPIYKGSKFGKALLKEMPHILHKCRKHYDILCPTGEEIIIPEGAYDRMLQDCGSAVGDTLDHYCGRYLEFGEGYGISSEDLIAHFCRVRKVSSKDNTLGELRRYLEKKGAACKRNNKTGRRWEGLRIKED